MRSVNFPRKGPCLVNLDKVLGDRIACSTIGIVRAAIMDSSVFLLSYKVSKYSSDKRILSFTAYSSFFMCFFYFFLNFC
jgi:hypothetical protein